MAIIAVVLAITFPSVVKLWYIVGSIFVPGLLIPFLITFTKIQMKQWQGLILMIIPVVTSIIWFILNKYLIGFQFRSEPFYPGMLASISIVLLLFVTNYKQLTNSNKIEN